MFGFVALIVLLSIVATLPVIQFISLGYLLESGRRVATGRIRDGFPGVRLAARLGSIAFCSWLLLQPLRLLRDLQVSAALLGNEQAQSRLAISFYVASALVLCHVAWATWRGGRVRNFLWPAPRKLLRALRSGTLYARARDGVYETVLRLQAPRLFWLGLGGFLVAFGWLVIPISILVASTRLTEGPGAVLWMIGSTVLAAALLYLPYAQLNFAMDDQMRAGFDWRRVRGQFKRAPIAFGVAMIATLLLAVPLYLLKAELLPREAAWLPAIVFVLSIWPARVLTGWAIGRAQRREENRHFISRWMSFLVMLPVVVAYVGIVYLTQYVSWYGAWSLYEQHAFMLPVPFLGM